MICLTAMRPPVSGAEWAGDACWRSGRAAGVAGTIPAAVDHAANLPGRSAAAAVTAVSLLQRVGQVLTLVALG